MIFKDREQYKGKIGIYQIVNKINDRVYIGQTSESFLRRFLFHDWELRKGCHSNSHLQRAWNKYGEENFEFSVVEVVDESDNVHEILDDLEIKYISESNNRYNIQNGGQARRAHTPLSEETKRKIGEKNRINMLGRKASEETKAKMSESQKKRTLDWSRIEISKETVFKIKTLLVSGMSPSEVAKELNLPYRKISNIYTSNTFKEFKVDGWDEYYKARKSRTYTRTNVSKETEELMRKDFETGMDLNDIAAKYNVCRACVRNHLK